MTDRDERPAAELSEEEIDRQGAEPVQEREVMSLLSPGSGGGAFGMAAAGDVAAEPSPIDDVYTIQQEPDAE